MTSSNCLKLFDKAKMEDFNLVPSLMIERDFHNWKLETLYSKKFYIIQNHQAKFGLVVTKEPSNFKVVGSIITRGTS